ncbi:MAG TPA: M14 family zinc carboxypeptidase [Bryobacteraceae bacterium]|nr:M14 family zinc carboxypeptidase [Bryobacteraceae bacterium]
MKLYRLIFVTTLAAGLTTAALAQTKQAQDEEYARLVKEWTTKPEFMSPLVDHLPKVAGVPTTKDILGYYVGAPKKLTHVADLGRYYRALAAASPRVKLLPAGQTDEGRECLVIAVSDEENIRNLETYRGYLAKLADPRGLSDDEARQIIAKAKPIYMFTGGLHSAETGPPEMLMELAYRLAVEDSPLFDQIRHNVIVMMTAAAEPDGRDRYTDWYYRHKLTEEKESDRVPGPPYWGKYIYHDNNRDINYSQVTMRNWLKFYMQWHPPIMHDLHESVPFMYTFSGQAPQNPTLDPILYAEMPWFSNFEMTKMFGFGMPGVWTHGFVDMWSPGYLGFMSSNHNGILRMYETFGNGGANTMKRNVAAPEGGGGGPGGSQTTREWYRPLPPYKEVVWSMRNNTNYMETGVLSALELTSGFAPTVLKNFYEKSRNSIESGKTEAPFGYVFPGNQPDMTRVAFIVNILRLQGIEVGRATSEVKLKEGTFPAGSLIVKRDQPYGRLAKILLEKQNFPDANLRTYDDTAWTMGLMSEADVKEIADKAILSVPVEPVDTMTVTGTVKGSGPVLAVLDNGSNSLVTLRYHLKNVKFEAIEQPFKNNGVDLPAGSFLIPASSEAKSEIEKLGLQAVALNEQPNVPHHTLDLPRLAIFSTWGATQDVGWVRYAFDHFEVAYDLIYKERVRKGNLRDSYDVIVIPNQVRGSSKSLVFDIESKGQPVDYVKGGDFKSLGEYGESSDITGGMGIEGVAELEKFVNSGGVLITLGTSSFFPADFGLTRTVDAGRTSPQFYAPGPIVEMDVTKPTHPIFYGYTQKTLPVRWANGPLLRVPAEDKRWILASFPGTDKSVLSGLMKGVGEIKNRPAIVDVPVGQGRVVLFATNPCYRWQNLGEFNMLANALLNFNDFPKASAPAPSEPTSAAP